MANYAFICHSTQDKAVADAACAALERASVRCWIAPRDLVPGIPYGTQIIEAIADAGLVLLIFSEHANRSEHVPRELELATKSKRVIVPFRIENVEPSRDLDYYITRVHRLDAIAPPMEARYEELIHSVQRLLDDGEHELKRTFGEAEKAFAADSLELTEPLLTASGVATVPLEKRRALERQESIPAQLTPFIGRETELAEAGRLIEHTRLLTMTGTGGVGKTRLAVQFANEFSSRFPGGRWFVDFGPLSDSAFVPSAMLSAIGLSEEAGRTTLDTLVGHLRERSALMVLDNCEHVVDEVARSAERLLHDCPALTIVATSREVLRLDGEVVHRIGTFDLTESVRLFENRASAVAPSFAVTAENRMTVEQICNRVEGIPLAIELAAARMRMMTLEELWKRLDDRFRILAGGSRTALPRQQTLHGLIGWSYNLLTEDEKALLRRLAIFSGEFSLEAAAAVCTFGPIVEGQALELLTGLIDKSLVQAEQTEGIQRYRMLESTKAYGLERLDEAGEWDRAQERHAEYFLSLAVAAESYHGTPRYDAFRAQTSRDYADFRAVLQRTLLEGGNVQLGAALAAALGRYWMERGLWREGRKWLENVVEHGARDVSMQTLAMALLGLAGQYYVAGEYAAMATAAQRSEETYSAIGDAQGQGRARIQLAIAATYAGEFKRAQAIYTTILEIAREMPDRRMEAVALQNLAEVLTLWKADYRESESLYEQAVAIHRERGDSRSLGTALGDWSQTIADGGSYARADALATEGLRVCREVGDESRIIEQLTRIGRYRVWAGARETAISPLTEAVDRLRSALHPLFLARCIDACADYAIAVGDGRAAATLLAFGEEWRNAKYLPRAGDYQNRYDAALASACALLSEGDVAAAQAAGAALTPEQTLDVMAAALANKRTTTA